MHLLFLNDHQIVTAWVVIVSCTYIYLDIKFRKNS